MTSDNSTVRSSIAHRSNSTSTTKKPYLKLVGVDGNAFNVLGLALRAAKAAGWTEAQRDAYAQAAMSGDYDNLLAVTQDYFDVR